MLRQVGLLAARREPAVSSASIAPSVSSGHSAKLRLALLMISMQAAPIVLGRPWPPNSAGCCRPCQPPSAYWRNASLKPGVVVTLPSFQDDGFCVAVAVQRRDHAFVELGALLEHRLRGVERRPPRSPAAWRRASRPASSRHAEQHVLDWSLISAHGAAGSLAAPRSVGVDGGFRPPSSARPRNARHGARFRRGASARTGDRSRRSRASRGATATRRCGR